MKKFLLTVGLFCAFNAKSQSLIGEKSEIISMFLELNTANYKVVKQANSEVAFIVNTIKDGVIVYYFKNNVCSSYSVIKHNLEFKDVEVELNLHYKKLQDKWYDESSSISAVKNGNTVFINVIKL